MEHRQPRPDRTTLDRRTALASIGVLGAGAALAAAQVSPEPPRRPDLPPGWEPKRPGTPAEVLGWDPARGEYVLPPLPYPADALEPYIDAQTMTLHHDKHHAGYVRGLNRAIQELAKIRDGQGDEALTKHWMRELAFNGSGHVNHTLFWLTMAPPAESGGEGGGGQPAGSLAEGIERDFGSFDAFAAQFKSAANSVEGSGWAWLVHEPLAGRLLIVQMEKHQNQALNGMTPLLGVDVWEHAYYLKYQNRRAEYVQAWMNVINWPRVQRLYDMATA